MMLSPGSFINIRPCSRRPDRRYRMPPAKSKTSVPPTILLVEAEPMLRQTMAKFLGRSGFQVVACSDADGAATALTQDATQPSLLVLAARVLDATTVALAHQLRALAPAVPMLGIADQIGPAAEAPSGLPRDLRFLAPPFDLPDVLRAVRSWLPQSPPPPEHLSSRRREA
jgi:DNA-binding response OmpR family regulator